MNAQNNDDSHRDDDSSTGLPFPRTWRSVYLLVIAIFVFYAALLAAFPKLFS